MKNGKIIYSRNAWEFSRQYAEAMNKGELVLHPCECMYCISFDFFDKGLRKRVDSLKRRLLDKNYVAIIPTVRSLKKLGIDPNKLEKEFIKRYWPGLLKIAFNDQYCIGIPKQKWLRDCLKEIDTLVGITSANKTGFAPVKKANQLEQDLIKGVDKVLLNDRLIYAEHQSTIVKLKKGIEILRQGEIIIDKKAIRRDIQTK